MRSVALAALIMAATPVDAAACHHFSVWRFPFPQRCRVATPGRPSTPQPASFHRPAPEAGPGPSAGLPALDWQSCPEADELTRARLILMEHAHAD
jgi:hypothetical protein